MTYQRAIAICMTILFSVQVYGDVIVSWGDGRPGVDYVWAPGLNELTIYHGNGLNYKFWVHDGSEEPGTGVIDNITVHQDATGDFTLLIREEYGGPGALDWNEGNLEYAGGTSTVTGVKVAGHIAEPDKAVVIDRLEGSLEVTDWVWNLTINEWSSLSPGTITVGEYCRWLIIVGHCPGDIRVDGRVFVVLVTGDLTGSLDMGEVFGSVHISGNVVDSGDNHV